MSTLALVESIFSENSFLMTICGIGFTLLGVILFVSILKGKTTMPKWTCIFNLMIVYMIFDFFELPAHISTGCIITFIAVYVFEKSKYIEMVHTK